MHDENPEAKVFIRGDADTVHFNIIRVLDILRSVGFYKVAFEIKSEALKDMPGPSAHPNMAQPLLYRPPPRWQFWAALGGAMGFIVAAVVLDQSTSRRH